MDKPKDRGFKDAPEPNEGLGGALSSLLDERDRMYARLEAGRDPWEELSKASPALQQLLEWDTVEGAK